MNNLAFTWKEQGQDIDAFRLIEQCVQLPVQILGAEHTPQSSANALMGWQGDGLEAIASGIKALGKRANLSGNFSQQFKTARGYKIYSNPLKMYLLYCGTELHSYWPTCYWGFLVLQGLK
jgi:hypothetical protein